MTVTYPHESGDVTVLGPECVLSADKAVISYAGENFYRALPIDPSAVWALPEATAELVQMAPLLQACRDRLSQTVTLHITGGMQVEGRLTRINEDDMTVIVVDRDDEFDVAIGSIAVVQGKR